MGVGIAPAIGMPGTNAWAKTGGRMCGTGPTSGMDSPRAVHSVKKDVGFATKPYAVGRNAQTAKRHTSARAISWNTPSQGAIGGGPAELQYKARGAPLGRIGIGA